VEATDGTLNDVEGHRLAFLHALDRGEAGAARDHLQSALDRYIQYPESARGSLFSEAAFFEAAVRADGEAARGWLDRLDSDSSGALSTGTERRARLAVAWADGGLDETRVEEAREAASGHALAGVAEAEHDWVTAIAQRPSPAAGNEDGPADAVE
jgi:hypothetical protein